MYVVGKIFFQSVIWSSAWQLLQINVSSSIIYKNRSNFKIPNPNSRIKFNENFEEIVNLLLPANYFFAKKDLLWIKMQETQEKERLLWLHSVLLRRCTFYQMTPAAGECWMLDPWERYKFELLELFVLPEHSW